MKSLAFILGFMLFSSWAIGQTQFELNEQAAAEYKKADKKLNQVYNSLIKMLGSKHEKDLLIKAEKAWITFREAHARYAESMYDGGSMQPLIYFDSMLELTKTRIKQIEEDINERKNH